MTPQGWRFWVDRGGTFTDLIARSPQGDEHSLKLLSENPEQYDDAILAGIRQVLGVAPNAAIPDDRIQELRVGTTVATNALLEHQGEPVLLITTAGFGDLLRIANQHRPDLFALDIEKPLPLFESVLEVDERLDAQGQVLSAPEKAVVMPALQAAREQGLTACALVFLHSYRNPSHEQDVAAWAREAGFTQVSVSSELSPVIRAVSRGDTAVVDAYLSPVLKRYVSRLSQALPGLSQRAGGLRFMQSNGGLCASDRFRGKDAILSGPAGGVVGMVKTAEAEGLTQLIGFDMGGTSTDVCHYNGELERQSEAEVAGFRLQTPMMSVHTVAAGGGSILSYHNKRVQVGPDSAGANPGPKAYRRGGPLTVTDCQVMLGRLQADFFPAVFGPHADQPLDVPAVQRAFALQQQAMGDELSAEAIAEGFLEVAIQNMALAVQQVSTQKGHDLKHYTLCSFGGAGGQHACRVAEELGISQVYLHPMAGLLSALGMGLADCHRIREYSIEHPLDQALLDAQQQRLATIQDEQADVLSEGNADWQKQVRHRIQVRLKAPGAETPFLLDWAPSKTLDRAFRQAHQQSFGFAAPAQTPIVHSLVIESRLPGERVDACATQEESQGRVGEITPLCRRPVYFQGQWQDTPFYRREALASGDTLEGPAIILESSGTLVLEPHWKARLSDRGGLILSHESIRADSTTTVNSEACDPVQLALFNNRFRFIAEQMGKALQQSARSVNIRERLDFSCALFTADGQLIANAPHVPVHLGSMGHSVEAVIAHFANSEGGTTLQPGDACALNDPFQGGTHLPDITVVSPVFLPGDDKHIRFFVAARGHHADLGGSQPGSMPWNSQHIDEEGIVIPPTRIVERGDFQTEALKRLLCPEQGGVRRLDHNLADLQAQVAACTQGAEALRHCARQYGPAVLEAYMQHMLNNAEQAVKGLLPRLHDGHFRLPLDNGLVVEVSIQVHPDQQGATIDFSGSSPQHSGNFNAPVAVVHAAVLYVFRCLVEDDIPLNAGCLRPLDIRVPEGSFLNPSYPAAVVAGNVEVSQAVVCALFGALGVKACAQGTMNNLVWGDAERQYYETLCGGDGASAKQAGQSAVQTHMTNSRLTDVEVLEERFPVRLRRFTIRQGSGGRGLNIGGDGVIREIEFLSPVQVSVLSNHREKAPFGLNGGSNGQPGVNRLQRGDGTHQVLNGTTGFSVEPGDRLTLETPGGGGFGPDLNE